MSDNIVTSFGVLNYSGLIFNKGNTRTPFSSLIGSKLKTTDHVEFVTGQEYMGGGEGSQPAISESESLTAPAATFVTRSQNTNVTQIFMESVYISYAKQSNMGTLAGVNIANQQANPMNELDFQVAAKMQKVNRDIEYTFINGTYQKATADNEANKTRGMLSAITSNVLDKGGKNLSVWDVNDMLTAIYNGNAPTFGLTLWCDPISLNQINADAQQNGLTIVPAAREINGIALEKLVLPMGEVYLRLGECLPSGTAMLVNFDVISPVIQPVPGKGNFFLEPLAKVGAGQKYQLFGQIGLDHGPEWYHGKFTNINSTFTHPTYSKSIFVAGGTVGSVSVKAVPQSATLNKSTVEAADTSKVAVSEVTYDVTPGEAPTLAYLWQIRAKTGTTWTDLTSSYTGYNTSELTVKAADAEKHYRCKVTASGSAVGTVYSNECTVQAA